MNGKIAWPMAGLAYGTALGFAGGFGGLGPFLLVLLLGALGFLAGRAVAGEMDVGEIFSGITGGTRKGQT